MSATGLGCHFAAGEIEAESYLWRDGFDEWLPPVGVADLPGGVERKPVEVRHPPPPPAAAMAKRVAPKPAGLERWRREAIPHRAAPAVAGSVESSSGSSPAARSSARDSSGSSTQR